MVEPIHSSTAVKNHTFSVRAESAIIAHPIVSNTRAVLGAIQY
jgi:hypothetical protein